MSRFRENEMASTFDTRGRDEVAARPRTAVPRIPSEEPAEAAVSWASIFAGSLATIAATMILLVLGAGAGLSVVSPWYHAGASATAVGVFALIWLVVVQWISSGLGGFLAGRLRTKWVRMHAYEIFFRDTAHGLLAWSLASVAGALLFASVAASGVGGAAQGATNVAAAELSHATQATAGSGQGVDDMRAYFVDTLFRSNNPSDEGNASEARTEASLILARSMENGQVELSPADATYLTQIVATRTGLSQRDAQQRVNNVVDQLNDAQQKLRQAADAARKYEAHLSLAIALSMLIGAFIASAAAALGGKIRDEY